MGEVWEKISLMYPESDAVLCACLVLSDLVLSLMDSALISSLHSYIHSVTSGFVHFIPIKHCNHLL